MQLTAGLSWHEPTPDELLDWGGNLSVYTLTGDGWRLASSLFVHAGLLHLFLNMSVLAVTGRRAEHAFGTPRMLFVYLAGGLMASCASAWWSDHPAVVQTLLGPRGSYSVAVGASGAVMALFGALLARRLLPANPAEAGLDAEDDFDKRLWQAIGLNVALGFFVPAVDQPAHIGGLVGGGLLGSVLALAPQARSRMSGAARAALAAALPAACVVALLQGANTADRRARRTDLEQAHQAERAERIAQAQRAALPPEVSLAEAAGQVVKFGGWALAFALSPDEATAYATDYRNNRVVVIDRLHGSVARQVAASTDLMTGGCDALVCNGTAASDIVALGSGATVVVSSMHPDAVTFLDAASGRIARIVAVGGSPRQMIAAADGKRLYVHLVKDNAIAIVDTPTQARVATVALPAADDALRADAFAMWFGPDGRRLFATVPGTQGLRLASFDVTQPGPASVGGEQAAYTGLRPLAPGSDRLFAMLEGTLVELSAATFEPRAGWSPCSRVERELLDVHAAGPGVVLAATLSTYEESNQALWAVTVTDLSTGVDIGTYPVEGRPSRMRFAADGRHLFGLTQGGSFVTLDLARRVAGAAPVLCPAQLDDLP